jgi:hypothetical protein
MLPIAMIPTGWALLIEPWRKIECLAVAFLTFMAASFVTVWAFGPGLLQVVLDTPGLAQSAAAIGIPPAPIQRSASYRLAARSCVTLWRYSNLFQPLFFSTLFGCLDRHAGHDRASHFSAWRESSQRHVKPIDLVLGYFWTTAILHYLLSLSYCVDCIIPHTNYYLPLGALAAAGLTEEILRLTGERRLAYVALGGLLVVAAMLQAFPSFPTLLRPRTGMVRMAATELAAQLRPNLPATGRILVLCDRVEAAQAVWLAGGVVEPRSMYLPSTFPRPRSQS